MKKFIQVVIVNHNPQINNDLEKRILDAGLTGEVKIAVNGGHALMHINHLHLNGRVHQGNILVLLALNTPMVSGYEFLTEYKETKNLRKENIQIAILDNGLTKDNRARVEKFGITSYASLENFQEDVQKIANHRESGDAPGTPGMAA